jgi:hypothetical protein
MAMSYCSMTEKCASMSKEECLAKGCTNETYVYILITKNGY